jgi:hypothetical protein
MRKNEGRYQIPLRISPEMKAWLQASAEHELRSMNAQIISVLRNAMQEERSAGTA